MNLRGSLIKFQKSGAGYYAKLAQLFTANPLISDMWRMMSQDLEQQEAGLRSLPSLFWGKLSRDEAKSIAEALAGILVPQAKLTEEYRTLQSTFQRMLEFEEPLILRAYTPIIRHLRTEWSDRALDFYIMVKAHVARMDRIVQPFSGNPLLMQKIAGLLERFEHDVQAPVIPRRPEKKARLGAARKASRRVHEKSPIAAGAARTKLALRKAAAGRPKRVVAKIKIARQRAAR